MFAWKKVNKKKAALAVWALLWVFTSAPAFGEGGDRASTNGLTFFAGAGPAAAYAGLGAGFSFVNLGRHHIGADVSAGYKTMWGFDGRLHYAYGLNHRAIGGLAYYRAEVGVYESQFASLTQPELVEDRYNRYLPGFFTGYEFLSKKGYTLRAMLSFSYNRIEYLIYPEEGFFGAWKMSYWLSLGYKFF